MSQKAEVRLPKTSTARTLSRETMGSIPTTEREERRRSSRRFKGRSKRLSSSSKRSVLESVGTVSTSSITTAEVPVPDVYRYAQEYRWDLVVSESQGLDFVHPLDGMTVLHLAIMSRTGYDKTILGQTGQTPTLGQIEALLQKCPKTAQIPCFTNTYTPLAYACLVVGRDTDFLELEILVRLILRHCPESTRVCTSGGLSSLDVHIVSYSQLKNSHNSTSEAKEDRAGFTGRTDTNVLRTLLEHDSSLAEVRVVERSKVSGPVELLYRVNADAFRQFSASAFRQFSGNNPQERSVLGKVSRWWAWRWMVLLLKYGTKKRPGERFLALHAATMVVGCPIPIIRLVNSAFPGQVSALSNNEHPLHRVCSWPCDFDCTSSDSMIPSRKSTAIHILLQQYPEGAFVMNGRGELPLELALSTRTTWDLGVRKLYRAYSKALSMQSSRTGLYPFMAAAAAAAGEIPLNQPPLPSSKRSLMTCVDMLAKQDTYSVRTIYGLLRANPSVLSKCFYGSDR